MVTSFNPFSTRFVKPGALAYRFPSSCNVDVLLDRLRTSGWWGQIVGPHGAGKSTLLHTLCPHLEAAGRRVVWHALHEGQRRLPVLNRREWSGQTQLVIDGYEQLSRWSRWRVKRACRRAGAGLLITAHNDMGLPILYEAKPSLEQLQRIVAELLDGDDRISSDDVARCFHHFGGNTRETLFALYDLFEQGRS